MHPEAENESTNLMRVPWNRGGLRSYLVLIGLVAGHATPESIGVGIPFLLAGVALHLWAKGCLHQNREVTTAGPYRFVRHPFYLANAFLDLGLGLMSGWWPLVAALPLWWLAIYVPTMRQEEADMAKLFGDSYAAYRARVPRLIPYCRPLPAQPGGFSWKNPNLSKTEVPRAFRFLSYPLMFVLAVRLRSEGLGLLLAPSLFEVLVAAACVSLLLAGRELRQHFKHGRWILPGWIIEDPSRAAIMSVTILLGVVVTSFEVEAHWAIWPAGITLLALSFTARGAGLPPAISEALLAIGLAMLFELMWLAMLLIPLYLAIVLDQRLTSRLRSPTRIEPLRFHPASSIAHAILLGAGVALCLAKEIWL